MPRLPFRPLSVLILAALAAAPAPAQILGDMQMAKGGARAQGAGNPGPSDGDYRELAEQVDAAYHTLERVADLLRRLAGHDPSLGADRRLESDVALALRTLERLKDLLEELRQTAAAGRSPRMVWDDRLPEGFTKLEKLMAPAGASAQSLSHRLQSYVNSKDREWHGVGPGVSADVKDPDVELIIALRSLVSDDLPRASAGLTEALAGITHTGWTLISPFEPFIPGRNRIRIATEYHYWPFNEEASGVEGFGTGVFDLQADVSVMDSLSLGIRLPFLVLDTAPRGVEREKGLGDVTLRADWWPTAGSDSILQWGAHVEGVLPTADEAVVQELGAGADELRFNGEFKLTVVPPGRKPRLHAVVGRSFEFDDELEQNHTDLVVGALWSHDAWRVNSHRRFFNLAAWVDVLGTLYDEEQLGGAAGPVDAAWDLRLGAAVLRITGHGGSSLRHVVTGEVQRRLDEETRNSNLAGKITYNLIF